VIRRKRDLVARTLPDENEYPRPVYVAADLARMTLQEVRKKMK
jgi:hypothetical protein